MGFRKINKESETSVAMHSRSSHIVLFLVFFGLLLFVNNMNYSDLGSYLYSTIDTKSMITTPNPSSPWDIAYEEAQELLSDERGAENGLPSCLVPNREHTLALVRDAQEASNPSPNRSLLPLPVINVGMPKLGSTTLFNFFECAGFRATHWNLNTKFFEGLCMKDAAAMNRPPLETCGELKGDDPVEAYMQLDVEFPFGFFGRYKTSPYRDECFFPQMSLLEELHAENPNITFVLNFRPIQDWVTSIRNWPNMMLRFHFCHLPGLPFGVPEDIDDQEQVEEIMTQFFCSHVQHLRNFVREHPSHALIELDLYDVEYSSTVLGTLFPGQGRDNSTSCWGHGNKSKKIKMKKPKPGPASSKGNSTRNWDA